MSEQDYQKLKETAQAAGKQRLAMLIETIASTGIRISELKYFTVEAVRKGRTQVRNKGKERMILMPGKAQSAPDALCKTEEYKKRPDLLHEKRQTSGPQQCLEGTEKSCQDSGSRSGESPFPIICAICLQGHFIS